LKAKITEIFRSVQGEGPYLGVDQIFVRFFDCNIQCIWCDTPTSSHNSVIATEDLTAPEIIQRVSSLWSNSHSLCLTGGEPLINTDVTLEVAALAQQKRWTVYLETNGILIYELQQIIDNVDIIAMDFKLPSSTKAAAFWEQHEEFLKVSIQKDVFVKAVITPDTEVSDLVRSVDIIAGVDPCTIFFLQPESKALGKDLIQKCPDFQKEALKRLNDVRVIPQVHKFMEIR